MSELTAVLKSRSAERVRPIVTASVLLTDESDNILLSDLVILALDDSKFRVRE